MFTNGAFIWLDRGGHDRSCIRMWGFFLLLITFSRSQPNKTVSAWLWFCKFHSAVERQRIWKPTSTIWKRSRGGLCIIDEALYRQTELNTEMLTAQPRRPAVGGWVGSVEEEVKSSGLFCWLCICRKKAADVKQAMKHKSRSDQEWWCSRKQSTGNERGQIIHFRKRNFCPAHKWIFVPLCLITWLCRPGEGTTLAWKCQEAAHVGANFLRYSHVDCFSNQKHETSVSSALVRVGFPEKFLKKPVRTFPPSAHNPTPPETTMYELTSASHCERFIKVCNVI